MSTKTPEDQTIATYIDTSLRDQSNQNATHVELFYKGKAFSFSKKDLPIKIGRDTHQCNICVTSHVVSRVHCELTIQDEQIGILDSSKNGTVIQIGRNENITVKDKFFPLIGQGHMQLGSLNNEESQKILFKVRFENERD